MLKNLFSSRTKTYFQVYDNLNDEDLQSSFSDSETRQKNELSFMK